MKSSLDAFLPIWFIQQKTFFISIFVKNVFMAQVCQLSVTLFSSSWAISESISRNVS